MSKMKDRDIDMRNSRKYRARFNGRVDGAIGITYSISTEVEGDSVQDAMMNLYRRYEHISNLELTEVEAE